MSKDVSLANIMKFAGAYVACAIGSGFATGQEVMQFFSAQGIFSIVGAIITTIIFSWVGAMFMKHGYEKQLESPTEIMEFYFGKKAGKIVVVLFQLIIFGIYVLMIAGAGATLSEYFGLNPMVGRIGMCLIAFLTVIMGLTKLTDILGSLGTVIVVFALCIGLISFLSNAGNLTTEAAATQNLEIIKTGGGWLWSGLLYPAFNAIVVLTITCNMGRSANSAKEAVCGGLAGGAIFGVAVIIMNLGIMANITEVYDKSVPTLALANNISPIVALVFSVIICCGIYTTTVPMLWGVARNFAEDGTKKMVITALILSAAGLILGMTDFKVLVNTIYPLSGYMGLLLFILVGIKDMTLRKELKTENSKAKNNKISMEYENAL